MRGLFMLILAIHTYAGIRCSGQERTCDQGCSWMVGMEVSEMIHERIVVRFGRRIAEKWSVGAATCLDTENIRRKAGAEEAQHRSEFETDEAEKAYSGFFRQKIDFSYWPSGVFEGCYVGIGAEYSDGFGIDGTLGIGYNIDVWKGITLSVGCHIGLRYSYQNGMDGGEGIRIGLNYKF